MDIPCLLDTDDAPLHFLHCFQLEIKVVKLNSFYVCGKLFLLHIMQYSILLLSSRVLHFFVRLESNLYLCTVEIFCYVLTFVTSQNRGNRGKQVYCTKYNSDV